MNTLAFSEHILGGVAGGVLSATLFYPIEAYETQLQTRGPRTACKKPRRARLIPWETIQEHYTGLDMAIGSALTGYTIFFATQSLLPLPSNGMYGLYPLFRNVISASLANLANAPFQLVKTRAVKNSLSSACVLEQALRTGGILSLWEGLWAHMLGVSTVAVQFCVYEQFIAMYGDECAGGCAAAGMIAAGIAGVITYPCVVVKSVAMGGKEEEEIGLYQGVVPFLARSIPPAGVLFAVMSAFEKCN